MKKYELVIKVVLFSNDEREAAKLLKEAIRKEKRVISVEFKGRARKVLDSLTGDPVLLKSFLVAEVKKSAA